ncbi:MAG: 4Fe-4S dicluster domain-containing protein [Candidatus Marinimicrobia bacterium]|nr:4Fe-4S dicluster domain-containing protein [Candidatus Neomarinimicrobiota bacterium]
MNLGFLIDNRKCIGCHACTVACKSEHEVPIGVNRTWVKYVEKGSFPDTQRLFSVLRCNHCEEAPCVEICPTGALYYRDNGIVDFDTQRCIACKSCMQACPYDALYIDPDDHVAEKCNFCAHRIDVGLEPSCVVVCPEEAIVFGDLENEESNISQLVKNEPVTVRKAEKGTKPKVYYIDGDKASLDPSSAKPDDQYLWSEQYKGVGHFSHFAEQKTNEKDPKDLLIQLAMEAGAKRENGNSPDEIVETLKSGDARRVYDSPSKGILWGWEVSAYVWTKAISSGLFFMTFFSKLMGWATFSPAAEINSLWGSLIFLLLTTVLLIKDLDQPRRFLYVILRPQWTSWLVKGAYGLVGFGGVLTLLILNSYLNLMNLAWLEWVGAALALFSAVYTAFLFAQAKGRDFWQSHMAPYQMVIHALLAGGAGVALLTGGISTGLALFMAGLLLLNLGIFAAELTTSRLTDDARTAAQMILRGRYAAPFWTAIGLTRIIPLIILFVGMMVVPIQISMLVLLAGILVTEHIWIRVPQLIALS